MKERLQAWGDSRILPVVGALALNPQGKLLLLQRHINDLGGGLWCPPGGSIDDGESPEIAVEREFWEETGVRCLGFTALGRHHIHMPHGTVHVTNYRAILPDRVDIRLNPSEHHAYTWLSPQDVIHEQNVFWGLPTVLHDLGLLNELENDPTLDDGSSLELLERAEKGMVQ